VIHRLVALIAAGSLLAPAAEIRLIAHRGGVVDSQFAENSPGAIEEAIRRGYWMIEVDIQPSRDGRLIVHHDENFLRYYGEPARVAELTWDRIVRLRARPGGSRPLQFHELAALACGRIRLMLDLKPGSGWTRAHFEQIESILRENDLLDSAIFISNNEAKAYFKGKARISLNRDELKAAIRAQRTGRHAVRAVPSWSRFHARGCRIVPPHRRGRHSQHQHVSLSAGRSHGAGPQRHRATAQAGRDALPD
jgi:glycerophosphoryl diester phosphodiesterase